MSQKEVDRAFSLSKVRQNQITLKQAAHVMGLSYAQTKRLWARYKKKEGPKGLISKKRGRKSNRAVSQEDRKLIAYESAAALDF